MTKPPEELADLPFAHLLEIHEGPLVREGRYDTVHFAGDDFESPEGNGADFIECAVTEASFNNGSLRRARFNDVWMRGTRVVGTSLVETAWLDSTVDSCVLAGVGAHASTLRRVVFRRCKFDSVNLRSAELRSVVFQDCVLRDVDFGGAALTDVGFPGSALERVHLSGARLKKADLRGATVLDLADGHDSLRGAVIDPGQLLDLAPALASVLGITVGDRLLV